MSSYERQIYEKLAKDPSWFRPVLPRSAPLSNDNSDPGVSPDYPDEGVSPNEGEGACDRAPDGPSNLGKGPSHPSSSLEAPCEPCSLAEKLSSMLLEAKDREKLVYLRSMVRKDIQRNVEKYFSIAPDVLEFINSVEEEEAKEDGVKHRNTWGYWIVWSPADQDAPPPLYMLDYVDQWVSSKSWIAEWWYSIEQRAISVEDDYHGFHVNLLIKCIHGTAWRSNPEGVRAIQRYFGQWGNVPGPALYIRAIPESLAKQKLNYLRGKKSDRSKDPAMAVDRQMRHDYGILDFYYGNSNSNVLDEDEIFIENE